VSSERSYAERAARLRVRGGFLLAAVYLIWAQPTPARLIGGVAVALAGLLLRAWSAGCLEKERKLATGGPYAHTRNPLYLGSAIAALGFAIAAGQWWFFLLLGFFLGAVYWPVIRYEQARLEKLFPEVFPAYAQAVPAFWPRLRPWRGDSSSGVFLWERYRGNREYRALLGSLVIVLCLLARMYLIGGS
jgi:protein-S-isoprenylcysteine O-methyltransferase Ste14